MPWEARAVAGETDFLASAASDRVPLQELIDIILDYSLLRFQSGVQP